MPELELLLWKEVGEGEPTAAYFREWLSQKGYEVTQYTYPPGTYFPPHTHDVDKIDVVLSGRFKMSMYGRSVILEAGDCLVVPRGAVHSAEVVGETAVVSLDAVRGR